MSKKKVRMTAIIHLLFLILQVLFFEGLHNILFPVTFFDRWLEMPKACLFQYANQFQIEVVTLIEKMRSNFTQLLFFF